MKPLGALALAALLLLGGCAEQMQLRRAQTFVDVRQWPEAVAVLEEAWRQHPESTVVRAQLLQVKERALAAYLDGAQAARSQGRLAEARALLDAAQALFPAHPRASELRAELDAAVVPERVLLQAQQLAERGEARRALELIDKSLQTQVGRADELVALKRRLEAQITNVQRPERGRLAESRPITLDFREVPLRAVLDAVTRYSGVNSVLDKDVRPEGLVSIYMKDVQVQDAIEMLTSSHQLAFKVVDPSSVLIYPNTVEKHREHQEQVVRVFFPSGGDAKGAAAFLKSMLKIREPFVDDRGNLVAIRDTPENTRLAERLMALYDTSEPEVLLEVEVLEVSSSRLTELGIKFPSSIALSPLVSTSTTGLTLGNAADINRQGIGVSVSGLLLNLKREVGDVSTLANPRLRARSKEKARILIGDKIPIVTTTAATGGFVSESVSYLEVGLKLDVEPTVYADDDVAIRIALEVSSLGPAVKTNNGTLAHQIGTRSASTLLRLHDGETQLLAGLISRDERASASRVPGIGDVPVVGRLFSSQLDQGSRSEILLAITPRILRNARRVGAQEAELWVGTDANPRMRTFEERRFDKVARPDSASLPSASGLERAVMPPTGGPALAAPQELRLTWAGGENVEQGATFELRLERPAGVGIRGLPLSVAFDQQKLQFVRALAGEALAGAGADAVAFQAKPAAAGRVELAALRQTASESPAGGTLYVLTFKALASGEAVVRVENAQAFKVQGTAPTVQAEPWVVRIR